MFTRSAHLIATTAAAAALLLTGCGRQLPAGALQARGAYPAGSVRAQTLINGRAPSLTSLMQQATTLLRKEYPNSRMYEVTGTRNDQPLNDVNDFASWSFGALDDCYNPTNTIVITYKNGIFLPPTVKHGFDFGRKLADLSPKLDLRDALSQLRKAAFDEDFRFVDLFKVINPAYTHPVYVFTAETAIVTVNGDDGTVNQQTNRNWITGLGDDQGIPAPAYN